MASVVSLYSSSVSATLAADLLAPKPVVLGTITCAQDTNTGLIPTGRSTVGLNWTLPTENEDITGEVLGTSTGGADEFYTDYNPIVAASYTVYAEGSALTETTDYTINTTTGLVTLVNGQTTNGDEITIDYTVTLQDIDHIEIYRIPGNLPLPDGDDYLDVVGHGSVETVNDAVSGSATTYDDVLTAAYNGETWTYYVFVLDDEVSPNASVAAAVMVETLVSIPQGLDKTIGDSAVLLSWTAIADDLFDGVNIYRCDGGTFVPASAVKANSTIISGTSFLDSAGNVTNRVAEGTLAFPVNGSTYTYKIESIDTSTAWTTGTQNQSSGQAEQLTASKSA